jgi:hypothetical protein
LKQSFLLLHKTNISENSHSMNDLSSLSLECRKKEHCFMMPIYASISFDINWVESDVLHCYSICRKNVCEKMCENVYSDIETAGFLLFFCLLSWTKFHVKNWDDDNDGEESRKCKRNKNMSNAPFFCVIQSLIFSFLPRNINIIIIIITNNL